MENRDEVYEILYERAYDAFHDEVTNEVYDNLIDRLYLYNVDMGLVGNAANEIIHKLHDYISMAAGRIADDWTPDAFNYLDTTISDDEDPVSAAEDNDFSNIWYPHELEEEVKAYANHDSKVLNTAADDWVKAHPSAVTENYSC